MRNKSRSFPISEVIIPETSEITLLPPELFISPETILLCAGTKVDFNNADVISWLSGNLPVYIVFCVNWVLSEATPEKADGTTAPAIAETTFTSSGLSLKIVWV